MKHLLARLCFNQCRGQKLVPAAPIGIVLGEGDKEEGDNDLLTITKGDKLK